MTKNAMFKYISHNDANCFLLFVYILMEKSHLFPLFFLFNSAKVYKSF